MDAVLDVVIPTRDRVDLLMRCLHRLAEQPRPEHLHVIVVDDGSRDATLATLDAYRPPYALTVVSACGGGPGRARNLGIAASDAALVAFLDDDVIPDVGWAQAVGRAFSDHPEADILIGRTTSHQYGVPDAWSQQMRVLTPPGPTAPFPSCNFAVRRAALERVGGFDTAVPRYAGEDTDWSWRAVHLGLARQFVWEMQVDHPPRPSSFGRHLARALDERGDLHRFLKSHRILGLFGITDLVQFVAAAGAIWWFPLAAAWPFAIVWLMAAYVRAAMHLRLRNYRPRDTVAVLGHSLLLPWVRLGAVIYALFRPESWRGVGQRNNPWESLPALPSDAVKREYFPPGTTGHAPTRLRLEYLD